MDHRRTSVADSPDGHKLWNSFKRNAIYFWDVIVVLSTIPSIFFVTFQVFYSAIPWQLSIIYIADLIYLISIVANFFKSYTKKGVKITSKKKIALHYISTTFFLDFVSILPLEVFCFAASNVLFVSALLRLNRCIRCYKVWTFLSKLTFTITVYSHLFVYL